MKLCKCGCLRKLTGVNCSRWYFPTCSPNKTRVSRGIDRQKRIHEPDMPAADIERAITAHLAVIRATRQFTVGDGWDQRAVRDHGIAPPLDSD